MAMVPTSMECAMAPDMECAHGPLPPPPPPFIVAQVAVSHGQGHSRRMARYPGSCWVAAVVNQTVSIRHGSPEVGHRSVAEPRCIHLKVSNVGYHLVTISIGPYMAATSS